VCEEGGCESRGEMVDGGGVERALCARFVGWYSLCFCKKPIGWFGLCVLLI